MNNKWTRQGWDVYFFVNDACSSSADLVCVFITAEDCVTRLWSHGSALSGCVFPSEKWPTLANLNQSVSNITLYLSL